MNCGRKGEMKEREKEYKIQVKSANKISNNTRNKSKATKLSLPETLLC